MVYIDDYNAPYGRMIMCHMIADTDEELYVMVDKIGVHRRWKHNNHYDICLAKKKLAIQHGAVEVSCQELAKISIRLKQKKRG